MVTKRMPDKPEEQDSPPGFSEPEPMEESIPPLPNGEIRATVEALLYAAREPLSLRELKKALPEIAPDSIRQALHELLDLYRSEGRGLQIVEVAGGYQITTRPEYHERVTRLLESKPPSRLSIQALETLAAIAYRQPITVPELIELRGVRSAGVVRTLLEKKLIRIVGRKSVVGRPLLYGTTKEFLLRFGLKGLDELPQLEDMADVFGDEAASRLEELQDRSAPVELGAGPAADSTGSADSANGSEPGSSAGEIDPDEPRPPDAASGNGFDS